jgi:hypothetical protein
MTLLPVYATEGRKEAVFKEKFLAIDANANSKATPRY